MPNGIAHAQCARAFVVQQNGEQFMRHHVFDNVRDIGQQTIQIQRLSRYRAHFQKEVEKFGAFTEPNLRFGRLLHLISARVGVSRSGRTFAKFAAKFEHRNWCRCAWRLQPPCGAAHPANECHPTLLRPMAGPPLAASDEYLSSVAPAVEKPVDVFTKSALASTASRQAVRFCSSVNKQVSRITLSNRFAGMGDLRQLGDLALHRSEVCPSVTRRRSAPCRSP